MTASQLRARYWRIVFFFGRVIAGVIFWEVLAARLGLGGLVRRNRSRRNREVAARFRSLAIDMGGLMIKVGQFLSTRLDVLPIEITSELAGLQDEVPAADFESIRAEAEAEFGQPLAELYAWVDEVPLAAASLGQVHRARLLKADAKVNGFADVVFKVQRPFIDQIVEVDLSALRRVAGWLQRWRPISDRVDVRALIEELANTTHQEIDYLAEGSNAERFAANFADEPRVHVPRVVWSLTTRRVLTLEDVSAIRLGDYEAITVAGIDRSQVASVLLDTYVQQVLEDGFFHADPHPGNLFVTPSETMDEDGNREWRLTFIDFGMMGQVTDNLRTGLREALIAIGTRDAARLVKSYKTLDVLLPSADLRLIETASMEVFDRFWGMSMSDLRSVDRAEMVSVAWQLRDLLLDLPFQVPETLLLLGRTVAILSGMCTGLDPDFNLWTTVAPYATKLVADEGGANWKLWLEQATRIFQVLVGLPVRADRVLTILERGELNVQTPLLNRRVRLLEQSVNRTTGAVVFAALLVAGAILYPADPAYARTLMGASALPLVWVMFFGRGHGPR